MYELKAKEARKKVLEMIWRGKTSHIASNFSVIDIATVLYSNLKSGDEVVWSKGWVAATIYYFLAQQGKIPKEDLEKFACEEDGKIKYLGLAETTIPGVLCNGGSVGHGLPIAVGMALGKKLSKQEGTVYCIMSDGELNEGSTWESLLLASHLASIHDLDNLVIIVDKNGWQAMGKTDDVIAMGDLFEKFLSFGFRVEEIDGHNFSQIEQAIVPALGPQVVIANTIKGKGVSFFENSLTYHYKHVDDETYEKALMELNA